MLEEQDIKRVVGQALAEDHGSGDLTTAALIPKGTRCRGVIVAKEKGVVAGLSVAKAVFASLDLRIIFQSQVEDGNRITNVADAFPNPNQDRPISRH